MAQYKAYHAKATDSYSVYFDVTDQIRNTSYLIFSAGSVKDRNTPYWVYVTAPSGRSYSAYNERGVYVTRIDNVSESDTVGTWAVTLSGNTFASTSTTKDLTIYYEYDSLGLSVTPSGAYVFSGSSERFDFTVENREGKTLSMVAVRDSDGATVDTQSVAADAFTITALYSWITNGRESETITVTVTESTRSASASFDIYRQPALGVTVTPSELYAGNSVYVSPQNLTGLGQYTFSYNSTILLTASASGGITRTCPVSWFDTAGVSSNSMRVTVTLEDEHNQHATASFTLKRPTGGAVTPTAPSSTTVDGGGVIRFTWLYNGDGTLSKTELQWSTDDATWQSLATVTGGYIWWEAASKTFPPGRVYWRARAYNSFGLWSDWSSSVNFTAQYNASATVVQVNSPTGGNISRSVDHTFGATLVTTGVPYTPYRMTSAVLHWRSNTSDPFTNVSMVTSGVDASVTIPANTFPAGALYWYIEATDNTGTTTETPVYTVSTLASDIDAQPVSPINTVEISNDDITFVWRFASTSGEAQNGADLEYSTDGTIWQELASVEGPVTNVIIPSGTFYGGTVYWRVRSYNGSGTSGPWSNTAQFVAYGAPASPTVTVDNKPFATIRWQGQNQIAFEIDVDGVSYGPFLGADKSYELFDYLKDGRHTAKVRILGDAELWSQWGETQFDIQNVPTGTITLRGRTNIDADLLWGADTGDYYVYRDGKIIARTNAPVFADRTALGTHDYQVIERLASGDYNASAVLTRTPFVAFPHIAALSGGDWIDLPHRLESQSDPIYSETQETAYNHLSGMPYPTASIGKNQDATGQYSALFLQNEEDAHRRFRALKGKPVILKTADDEVMIGILHAWERASKNQDYTAYQFSIQRIGWEDFIDDTQ